MEKLLIYISVNRAVVCLSSYPLYTLQVEAFSFPTMTGCPDKKLNSPKMLKHKGQDEGCEPNA